MTDDDDKEFTIDWRAFEIPLPETTPTIEALLRDGTPSEKREALQMIGIMLKSGRQLPAELAEKIGDALVAIGDGSNEAEALGLPTKPGKEKTYGVRYRLAVEYIVRDLELQGASRDDALTALGDLEIPHDPMKQNPDGTVGGWLCGNDPGGKIKKRLRRSRTK